MREKIIDESIESLRKEGLKFSVDTLAEKLNISKKTVYKYFPDKEALAVALYEKYFAGAINRARELCRNCGENAKKDLRPELLCLYYDAKTMTGERIFNKYKLNGRLRAYAGEQIDSLWAIVSESFSSTAPEELGILRIIVDGSFEKLGGASTEADAVIERLVKLL